MIALSKLLNLMHFLTLLLKLDTDLVPRVNIANLMTGLCVAGSRL